MGVFSGNRKSVGIFYSDINGNFIFSVQVFTL
jgi:hypothetical protein